MAPFSACMECRRNKIKCRREEGAENCVRCTHLGSRCQVVPRKLGRKLGSKNRVRGVGSEASSSPRPSSDRSTPLSRPTSTSGRASLLSRALPSSPVIHSRVLPTVTVNDVYVSPSSDPYGAEFDASGTRTPGGAATATSTFNMLSVLARVADDQPQEASPETARESRPPFDRVRFLDDFHEQARCLDPNPYRGMSLLEEGLRELQMPVEAYTPQPGEELVYGRIDQPRFDTAHNYDPVTAGVVKEREAIELHHTYWTGTKFRTLDPDIHTLPFLRSKSALLTTVVLLIGAQSLPVSGHTTALVERLDNHVEWLITQAEKHCFQSLEICQALLIFVTSLGGKKLNRVWPLAAKATTIAIELRLDSLPPPKWATAPSPHHNACQERLARNVDRMIILLVDWECGSAFFRNRRCMLPDMPQVEQDRLLEWCAHPLALPYDAMAGAAMFLLRMFVQFQLEVAQLQAKGPIFDLGAHIASVDAALQGWKDVWYPKLVPSDRAMAESDMMGFRFVLLTTLYEYGIMRQWPKEVTNIGRDACLSGAQDIIPRAIAILGGTHELISTSHMYSYRYYRMAYTAFFTLRIISTSPRSGDHDMFLLSLTATLARRLIDLRLHENITGITHVLGRRLMNSTRRLAAARIACGTPAQAMDLFAAHLNGNGDAHQRAETPRNGQVAEPGPSELPFELGGALSSLVAGYGGDIFTLLDPSVIDSFYFDPGQAGDMGMSGLLTHTNDVGGSMGPFGRTQ